MTALHKFSELNNSEVTREELIALIDQAKEENETEIIYRLSALLSANPEFDTFYIELHQYDTKLENPKHAGDFKEALTSEGKLRKGWGFTNGSIVKISVEKEVKNKTTTKKTTPKVKKSVSKKPKGLGYIEKLGYQLASEVPEKAENIFRLPEPIGNFVQDIQPHKELIIIKGNKHSSKSQLAMQISNGLGEIDKVVAFIDYEQGGMACKDTIDSINRNTTEVGKQNIVVKGYVENPMQELKELAEFVDAIVADSITDLKISADELNYLRNKYPETIWIFISQVKENGEMYGGNKMAHNPTKIINCSSDKNFENRIATLEKNRGNDLEIQYNIFSKELVI